jgi:hypothetical protein
MLTGATALAAVAGGRHSIFATLLLGLLSLGMAHSLFVEIRRQARRRARWSRHDTVNTVVLAFFGEAALLITLVAAGREPVRAVGPILSLVYATACALFVTDRRRAIAAAQPVTNRSGQSEEAATTEPVPHWPEQSQRIATTEPPPRRPEQTREVAAGVEQSQEIAAAPEQSPAIVNAQPIP